MIESLKQHRVISIVGNAKNAGKTTILNHLMKLYQEPLIITSIGLDGESIDQVTFREKPRIYARSGDLIATSFQTLKQFEADYTIIMETGIHTAIGEVVLCRIEKPGKVLVAGPSKVFDMEKLIAELRENFPYKILVDGAFFRQSFARISDGLILVIGAHYSRNMALTVNNAKLNYQKFTLPYYDGSHTFDDSKVSLLIKDKMIALDMTSTLGKSNLLFQEFNHVDGIYIPKALTDEFVETWTNAYHKISVDVIVDSPVNIQLKDHNLKNLFQLANHIYTRHPLKVLAVAMNPYSPSGYSYSKEAFKKSLEDALGIHVIDVKEDDEHE